MMQQRLVLREKEGREGGSPKPVQYSTALTALVPSLARCTSIVTCSRTVRTAHTNAFSVARGSPVSTT